MTDAEVKNESFLEAINSMLATGEIPGLIPKEDRDLYSLESKNVYMKEVGKKGEDPPLPALWKFFINRVKDCLHMILCFSPVGEKFRQRSQTFPSLFSQCSIDFFLGWPEDALVAVSTKFLTGFKMDAKQDVQDALQKHMGKCHDLVNETCEVYFQRMRRRVYVTPKSYLSFIDLYKDVYTNKYKGYDVEAQSITVGLEKLREAAQGVEELKVELREQEKVLNAKNEEVDKLIKELEIKSRDAKEKADSVAIIAENCKA